jgi:tRNA dimethylallyltransferase
MTNKPLFISIVGQTATGKTDKAFSLAEIFCKNNPDKEVIVISADSKQVFEDLSILSGADVPKNFKKEINDKYSYPFFSHPNLPIYLHGTSFLSGDQDWSVGHFHNLVKKLIINHPKALFIMVGGTGLYHQQIYHPATTLHIKPNHKLRESLEQKTLVEIQAILENKNLDKYEGMNNSDKNNPRRLIRAIEVTDAKVKPSHYPQVEPICKIGLTTNNIEEKINHRVKKRLNQGVIEEIKNFEKKYPMDTPQTKSTLGYQEILNYINKEISEEELISLWTLSEIQYSKRQNTWWKKREGVEWLNANEVKLENILNKL